MPTLDEQPIDVLFCMFTGEPGTRKSTQALSFPKPIYFFDVDKKIQSLITPALKWRVNPKEVVSDSYKDQSAIEAKLKQFQLRCDYKTIVLDSVTSTGDVTNLQILRAKSGTTKNDGSEKGGRVGGIPINTIEDYKGENSAFSDIMDRLKDIHKAHKVNVIVIAHVIGERDQSKQQFKSSITARTIITGGRAISGKLPAYCQEIYYFHVIPAMSEGEEGEYALNTVHTGSDFARTALPLDKKIKFGEKPLYETYLKPAIEKQQQQIKQQTEEGKQK